MVQEQLRESGWSSLLGTSGAEVVWSNGEWFLVPTGKDSVATMVALTSILNEVMLPTAKIQRL